MVLFIIMYMTTCTSANVVNCINICLQTLAVLKEVTLPRLLALMESVSISLLLRMFVFVVINYAAYCFFTNFNHYILEI